VLTLTPIVSMCFVQLWSQVWSGFAHTVPCYVTDQLWMRSRAYIEGGNRQIVADVVRDQGQMMT
jgi:hypothetical protein